MIDNSWAWASRRGKIRTNPVHKREEAKLVLEDWFEKKNETGEDIAMSGSAVLEDRPFTSMGSLPHSLTNTFPVNSSGRMKKVIS